MHSGKKVCNLSRHTRNRSAIPRNPSIIFSLPHGHCAPLSQNQAIQKGMAKDKSKEKEVARALYLKGVPQSRITELSGISRQSLSRWINREGWKEEKAAREMTRETVISKSLSYMGNVIDKAEEAGDKPEKVADTLIKTAKTIKEIGQYTNVVNKVDTLIEFENWIIVHREDYPELDDKMIVLINRLHSDFMNIKFKRK